MEKFDIVFEPTKTKEKNNKVTTTHTCKFPFTEHTKPIIVSKIIMNYDRPINVINLLDCSFKLGKRYTYGFKEILFATVFYKCLLYRQKCKILENKLVIKPVDMCINSFISVFDSQQTTCYVAPNECRFRTSEQISIKMVLKTSDQRDVEQTLSVYRILNPIHGVYFGKPRFIVVSGTTSSYPIDEDTFDITSVSYSIDVSDSLCIERNSHIVMPCDIIVKKIGDYEVYFIPLQFIKDQTLNFTSIYGIANLLKSKYLIDQPQTGLTDMTISTDIPNAIEACHIICVEL